VRLAVLEAAALGFQWDYGFDSMRGAGEAMLLEREVRVRERVAKEVVVALALGTMGSEGVEARVLR